MATFTGADRAIGYLFEIAANIASEYDSSETYSPGDYAIYSGTLYKCTTTIASPEAFTPAHWQAVLVMDEVAAGGGGGGTTVIANPAGAATDTIYKIQVESTIYELPGGWLEVTGTLAAGQTSITLSNAGITTTATVDIYTDQYGVNPTGVTISAGSITITFAAQLSAVNVKVRFS